MERVANDAADVLIRTTGQPVNWPFNLGALEVVGLAENDAGMNSIINSLSMRKLENLRQMCATANWDSQPNVALAVKSLFGNSEKFEISLFDETTGQAVWPVVYPRWHSGPSGVENSLEVVVVKRLVGVAGMRIENVIENVHHLVGHLGGQWRQMEFNVKCQRDLDTRDWYILFDRKDNWENNNASNFKFYVNAIKKNEDNAEDVFQLTPPRGYFPIAMRWHAIDIPTLGPAWPKYETYVARPWGNALHRGNNFIRFRVVGPKEYLIDVYIISVPRCTPVEFLGLPPVASLEVKLWR